MEEKFRFNDFNRLFETFRFEKAERVDDGHIAIHFSVDTSVNKNFITGKPIIFINEESFGNLYGFIKETVNASKV